MMPPLFVDLPTSFRAVFLRGAVDLEEACAQIEARGLEPTLELKRVVGVPPATGRSGWCAPPPRKHRRANRRRDDEAVA
jgi:hypothetical protein